MKRINATAVLILLVLLLFNLIMPVYAADIKILLDGNVIKSVSEFEEFELNEGRFCLDAQPVVKDGRVFVPLRLLAEMLDVKVDWQNEGIALQQGEDVIMLTLNSKNFVRNGQTAQMDAMPIMRNNRVLVPLRYVAEWFGCDVAYTNGQVQISTVPFTIDGVKVAALYDESYMTIGSKLYAKQGNLPLRNMYNALTVQRGEEVAAPERYGFNADIGDYHHGGDCKFVDEAGNVLADFTIYRITYWPPVPPDGYTTQLVLDNQTNKWYLLDDEAYTIFCKWQQSFDAQLVKDTVA